MLRLTLPAASALLLAGLAGIATPLFAADAPAPAAPAARTLSASDRTALEVHIMAGEMAAARGQPGEASLHFLAALQISPDPELAQRATGMAIAAGSRELAIKAGQRWLELEPNEMEPREVIARISVEQGDAGTALEQFDAIATGHAGGLDEGLTYVGRLLAQASGSASKTALQIASDLAGRHPQAAAGQQMLSIVNLRFGNLDAAEAAARKARALAPKAKEPAVLLAGVLVRRGQLQEADGLFEEIIRGADSPAEMRLGYAKVLLEAGQREAAREQTRKALKDQPGYIDALYALGVMALNDRAYDEAEGHFKQVLGSARAQDAAYQLGLVAEARGQDAQALTYFEKVGSGTLAIDAAVRRGAVLMRLQRKDEARALMARLREALPHAAARFYIAEASMLADAGNAEEALTLLTQALKEQPDDADLLYSRSLLHEKQKRIDLAEADLRSMLRKDADDARALNALGYMLTVNTKRYKEARDLIQRALVLDPDDAAVLDSLGWVQFKLGKTAEARDLLQKAHDKMPDPEVSAHLGEVLWALGEKDKAQAVWERALKDDPDHGVLTETLQRLRP